jgi:outer membrane protein OmpA-like peptidoglycan-associated protein
MLEFKNSIIHRAFNQNAMIFSKLNLKNTFLFSAILLSNMAYSQQMTVSPTDNKYISKKYSQQHEQWRKGENQFPGRPRDMWQVGVGGGYFAVSGDVKSQFGWGTGIHVRKSIGYVMSLRAEYMYGQASGLNYKASPALSITDTLYNDATGFYSNYKMKHHAISLQAVFNLNNIQFHRRQNKWALNAITGVGMNFYNTAINALDANGQKYDFTAIAFDNNGDPLDISTAQGRREVKNNLKGVLDNTYETTAPQRKDDIITIGEGKNSLSVNPYVNVGFSFEYLITPRVSLSLEHQLFITADDFMDGKFKDDAGGATSSMDLPQYTSVKLGFHIGNKEKRVQPLWFVNPLLAPMGDIANLKRKLDDDWYKDDDNDGVSNKIDLEPETPEGALVDTKGRALDSDLDGVKDYLDKELHSPPGYKVDENGVADVPKPLTQKDISIVKNNDGTEKLVIGNETFQPKQGAGTAGGLKDWFLPMIHFDMDKYDLRPESYAQLSHIATVMKAYPDLKVVVHGHTDVRANDEYNDMLSYNRAMAAIDHLVSSYGVERSNLIVKYTGKKTNLVPGAVKESDHFQNRRVEFYVAKEGDAEMECPASDGGANRTWKFKK